MNMISQMGKDIMFILGEKLVTVLRLNWITMHLIEYIHEIMQKNNVLEYDDVQFTKEDVCTMIQLTTKTMNKYRDSASDYRSIIKELNELKQTCRNGTVIYLHIC